MKKPFILIICLFLITGIVGGLAYYFLKDKDPSQRQDLSPKQFQQILQGNIEKEYRQKQYGPLIEVYKQMLKQFPDSIDTKKKLAFAYFGAEDYSKALPLLEEVEKAGKADDEVKRELEFIRKE